MEYEIKIKLYVDEDSIVWVGIIENNEKLKHLSGIGMNMQEALNNLEEAILMYHEYIGKEE